MSNALPERLAYLHTCLVGYAEHTALVWNARGRAPAPWAAVEQTKDEKRTSRTSGRLRRELHAAALAHCKKAVSLAVEVEGRRGRLTKPLTTLYKTLEDYAPLVDLQQSWTALKAVLTEQEKARITLLN